MYIEERIDSIVKDLIDLDRRLTMMEDLLSELLKHSRSDGIPFKDVTIGSKFMLAVKESEPSHYIKIGPSLPLLDGKRLCDMPRNAVDMETGTLLTLGSEVECIVIE